MAPRRWLPLLLAAALACDRKAEPASAPPAVEAAASEAVVPADVPVGVEQTRDAELGAEATKILNAFSDTAPRITSDGAKVVFLSNRDGPVQLYAANPSKPAEAPARLIETTERVQGTPVLTPDGKSALFLAEKGPQGNVGIFLVGLNGVGLRGQILELTQGEALERETPFMADRAIGATMLYAARDPKKKGTRVYVQAVDAAAPVGMLRPRLAYTDPSNVLLADVSRDGKSALLLHYVSMSESKLLLLDVGAGTTKPVKPPRAKDESLRAASFAADGGDLFVTVDTDDEGILARLDGTTFAEKARYVVTQPATARIAELAVSKKGDKIAIALDAGNHTEVRLLDARTLRPSTPVSAPLGSGGSLRFSDDGKLLALEWSTPNLPREIQAIDVVSGKMRPLREDPRPEIAGLPKVTATITEVASFDGVKIPVNVTVPEPLAAGADPLPPAAKLGVLVMIHGGPAEASQVGWSAWARFYSAHGFAIVNPNIRGSTGFGRAFHEADNRDKRLDAMKDVTAVGRWVAAQPWADPARLVLFGVSYGGYATLMGLAEEPSLWKAGVDVVGIVSWATFLRTTTAAVHAFFTNEIGADTDAKLLESISARSRLDKITSPLFVYAGQSDARVPRADSDAIASSLRARSVPVEYMVAPNEAHTLDKRENQSAFLARSLRFLESKLRHP